MYIFTYSTWYGKRIELFEIISHKLQNFYLFFCEWTGLANPMLISKCTGYFFIPVIIINKKVIFI